eukprot:3899121-Prymnesium_polylepis.2
MARASMPTAKATSGRAWVEQYMRAPTILWYFFSSCGGGGSDCARASTTSVGRLSSQGACSRVSRPLSGSSEVKMPMSFSM